MTSESVKTYLGFLGVATVFAYLLTYLWELGFCVVFGIPWEFISLNPASIVVAALALLTFVPLVSYLAAPLLVAVAFLLTVARDLIGMIRSRGSTKIRPRGISSRWRKALALIFPILLTIVTFLFTKVPHKSVLSFGAYIALGLTGIGAATWAIAGRRTVQAEIKDEGGGLLGAAVKVLRVSTFELLAYLIFFLVLSWCAGHWWALNQDSFLVPTNCPDTVVLKIYGDKVITAPFNRSTRAVERKFRILKPDSDQLRWEKTGKLHPQE